MSQVNDITIGSDDLQDSGNDALFRYIVDTMQDGVLIVTNQQIVTYANQRFCDMLGYEQSELIGMNALIFLASDAEEADMAAQVENRLERKSSTYPMRLLKKNGREVWMKISASPIVGKSGTVIGSIGVHTDISEEREEGESMRRSLDEKEILLKEVHHRVKNNMQIISSLLSLQLRALPDNEHMSSLIRDSQMRIQSMALVHEILYGSDNFKSLDFKAYVNSLTLHLKTSMGVHQRDIQIISEVERIDLELDRAIPCGLIINELMSNAIKYAFTDESKDQKIQIRALAVDGNYLLEVCDNGIGLPSDIDPQKSATLGLQLVETLAQQLDGSLQTDRTNGTKFTIHFPIAMP